MHKLLIFDFDGTITTGSNEAYVNCYATAAKHVGVELEKDVLRERVLHDWGKGPDVQLGYILREHPELVDAAAKHFETCVDAEHFFDHIEIVKGAPEVLRALARGGCRLAIASGSRRDVIENLLTKFGIHELFPVIESSYEIMDPALRKPNPHILELVMNKFSIQKENCYYIGDSKSDITTAKNAEIKSIAVLTGYMNQKDAEQMKSDIILQSITDLSTIF